VDWKAIAMRNLADQSTGQSGMQPMRRPTGELSALAMTFDDGLGPSRLLFRGALEEQFPNGYRVAIPEMSCGFAFAKDLKGDELANIEDVISKCYKNGTYPIVPGIYDADDLLPLDESN